MVYIFYFNFPNLNGCTVEVLEWTSDSVIYFIVDVITYPYCDNS